MIMCVLLPLVTNCPHIIAFLQGTSNVGTCPDPLVFETREIVELEVQFCRLTTVNVIKSMIEKTNCTVKHDGLIQF